MAMAWRAGAAPAGLRASPLMAKSAPSITVRRDACHCIAAGEADTGANRGRMRFGSGLAQFITRKAVDRPRIFGAFVALLQA